MLQRMHLCIFHRIHHCIHQRTHPDHNRCTILAARVCAVSFVILSVSVLQACQPVQPIDDGNMTDAVASAPSDAVSDSLEVEPALTTAEATAAEPEAVSETASDVAGDAGATDRTDETVDAQLVEAGLLVYRAQYCGICHEFKPAGTTGRFGPPHDGIGVIAASRLQDPRYDGDAQTVEEYLYESLVFPDVYVVEGYVGTSHAMPPYSHLAEEELAALVALMAHAR